MRKPMRTFASLDGIYRAPMDMELKNDTKQAWNLAQDLGDQKLSKAVTVLKTTLSSAVVESQSMHGPSKHFHFELETIIELVRLAEIAMEEAERVIVELFTDGIHRGRGSHELRIVENKRFRAEQTIILLESIILILMHLPTPL